MHHVEVTDITRHISVDLLMKRYRNAERFIACCRQCSNYARQWSCPPFNFDPANLLAKFHNAEIIATLITLPRTDIPLSEAESILQPQRQRLEQMLLDKERNLGGRSFATIGQCHLCHPAQCTRPDGLPCRHPDLVRPSLEAFGFDITAILADLFNHTLSWGSQGHCPSPLTLVTAHMR